LPVEAGQRACAPLIAVFCVAARLLTSTALLALPRRRANSPPEVGPERPKLSPPGVNVPQAVFRHDYGDARRLEPFRSRVILGLSKTL